MAKKSSSTDIVDKGDGNYLKPEMANLIKQLLGETSGLKIKDAFQVIPPIFEVLNGIVEGRYIVTDNPYLDSKDEDE